jgi:hypothetical protein
MVKKIIGRIEPRVLAGLLSIIVSYITLLYHQPFNVDGIEYLRSAASFLQSGFQGAIQEYPWPFYPILIAITSKLTHFSLENAAYFLNVLLTALAVTTFIRLTKELGGSRRVQYFAMLVILIYPSLNHDRSNILRDFGYYAFAPLGMLYLLRYLAQPKWRYVLAWSISTLIAALFRIEGFVFLVFAPVAVLFQAHTPWLKRTIHFLKLNTLNIIAAVVLIAGFSVNSSYCLQQVGHLHRILIYLIHLSSLQALIVMKWSSSIATLRTILTDTGADAAGIFLVGGLAAIFIQTLITTTGIFYTFLIYYALQYHLIPKNQNAQISWYAYLSINSLLLISFLILQFFLSTRYVFFLSYLLLLVVPFSLERIYQHRQTKRSKIILILTTVFLLSLAVDSFYLFGTSKTYIIQAGQWVNQHTPANSQVYSNDPQMAYYSHRPGTRYPDNFINNRDPLEQLQKINLALYDYVALVIHHEQASEESSIVSLPQLDPIMFFYNKKLDRVIIFQVRK